MKFRDVFYYCVAVIIDRLFMNISIIGSIAIGTILFMFMNAVDKYRYKKQLKHDRNRR